MINKSERPRVMIQPRRMTDEEYQQLEMTVARCSGFVKMMTGTANNAALSVMRHAYSKIADIRDEDDYKERPRRPHPGYRQRAKQLFGMTLREVAQYRSRLLHPATGETRFFHVDDMLPDARKRYGNMTDQQFFEFWEGTGVGVYQKSLPMINSLWNKYRKAFEGMNIAAADQTAWAVTAMTCLELAAETWEGTIQSVCEAVEGRLREDFIRRIYRPFSLQGVADLWMQAILAMSPETATRKLSGTDERNVELGIDQLKETWISPDMPFAATMQAVEDYDEDIFRTRGEARKALRELAEMRDEAVEDVKRMKKESKLNKT